MTSIKKIPKCKECEYLHQYIVGKHTYYDCYHPETLRFVIGKRIYLLGMKTSPKWCPKRVEIN
jgi:hypothetical protein